MPVLYPFPILLLTVVISAYLGGLRTALISAVLTVLYGVHFFAEPGLPAALPAERGVQPAGGRAGRARHRGAGVPASRGGRSRARAPSSAGRGGSAGPAGVVPLPGQLHARLVAGLRGHVSRAGAGPGADAGRLVRDPCDRRAGRTALHRRRPPRSRAGPRGAACSASTATGGFPSACRPTASLMPVEVTEELLRSVAEDDEHRKLYRALKPTWVLQVPLRADGRLAGRHHAGDEPGVRPGVRRAGHPLRPRAGRPLPRSRSAPASVFHEAREADRRYRLLFDANPAADVGLRRRDAGVPRGQRRGDPPLRLLAGRISRA